MSRTIRSNKPRKHKTHWTISGYRCAPTPKPDSKPVAARYICAEGKKQDWRCRCEDYCIAGKLHKHARRNHPLYHDEAIEYGLLHTIRDYDGAHKGASYCDTGW